MMKINLRASTLQALKILKYIGECQTQHPEEVVSCKDAAAAIHVTPSYFMQVIRVMMKKGLVRSIRGRTGGFQLVKGLEEITLYEIVEMMEGDDYHDRSLMDGMNQLEHILDTMSESVDHLFQNITVSEVC